AIINPPRSAGVSDVFFGGPNMQWLYVTDEDNVYRRPVKRRGAVAWNPVKPPQPRLSPAALRGRLGKRSCNGNTPMEAVTHRMTVAIPDCSSSIREVDAASRVFRLSSFHCRRVYGAIAAGMLFSATVFGQLASVAPDTQRHYDL